MAKPNQVQPNQLWFSHWNTHKRLTINEIWLLSKMYLQRPFRYLNFCQNLWKNGLHPSWIHFGPLRTHFIQKIFFFPMLLYKIQTFLILDSFDDLPVVGWWNVLLVVQNEFQMVKNQFLNFFAEIGTSKGGLKAEFWNLSKCNEHEPFIGISVWKLPLVWLLLILFGHEARNKSYWRNFVYQSMWMNELKNSSNVCVSNT